MEGEEALARVLRSAHLQRANGSCKSSYWQNYFVGADLITLMAHMFRCDREAAVRRANKLMTAGQISAAAEGSSFEDGLSYYRFEVRHLIRRLEPRWPHGQKEGRIRHRPERRRQLQHVLTLNRP